MWPALSEGQLPLHWSYGTSREGGQSAENGRMAVKDSQSDFCYSPFSVPHTGATVHTQYCSAERARLHTALPVDLQPVCWLGTLILAAVS